jgi:hypothetical protein
MDLTAHRRRDAGALWRALSSRTRLEGVTRLGRELSGAGAWLLICLLHREKFFITYAKLNRNNQPSVATLLKPTKCFAVSDAS